MRQQRPCGVGSGAIRPAAALFAERNGRPAAEGEGKSYGLRSRPGGYGPGPAPGRCNGGGAEEGGGRMMRTQIYCLNNFFTKRRFPFARFLQINN